ncbi:MAG TPA: acyl-CoA dehydrogenase family protein, partial [Polyangiales bacterium]
MHTGLGCVGLVRFGSDAQKQKYLPEMASGEWIGSFALTEPNAGSDAGAMTSGAVRKGDEWILSGTKTFITNASKAPPRGGASVCPGYRHTLMRTEPTIMVRRSAVVAGAGLTGVVPEMRETLAWVASNDPEPKMRELAGG